MVLGLLLAVPFLLMSCGGGGAAATPTTPLPSPGTAPIPADIGKDDRAHLTGVGATFPAPVYQAWFDDYHKTVARGVAINYQPIGSGGGIAQFTNRTVDFAASDAPMSAKELAAAPGAQHLPTVLGAITLAYNLPGLDAPLRLDGETIAAIYLGQVTRWDDPAIANLNPGAKLPASAIAVVFRSDSSGTTFTFTDYLSKVSGPWKAGPGTGKAPNWPTGQGAKGNEGVTSIVKQTPNAIGYVELQYAKANHLPVAEVENKAGAFVAPTIEAVSAAAAGVEIPPDYRVSITNADGKDAYPITAMTFLLVYKTMGECAQQTPLVDMLWWLYHSGDARRIASDLGYAPLPESLRPRLEATLRSLQCDGGARYSLEAS